MPKLPKTPLARYGLTLAAVAVATVARSAMGPLLGTTHKLLTFTGVVILTSWLCGLGPSILAMALGAVIGVILFIDPFTLDRVRGLGESVGVVLYFGVNTAIIVFGETTRVARRRLEGDVARRKEAEERLYQQRQWLRVTLASIGDAVIATDVSGQVSFLNPMAEALYRLESGRGCRIPLERVFAVIHEANRRPVESPASRVLAHGTAVVESNHTLLVARDGTERAVDDSAAPIRDESRRGHRRRPDLPRRRREASGRAPLAMNQRGRRRS